MVCFSVFSVKDIVLEYQFPGLGLLICIAGALAWRCFLVLVGFLFGLAVPVCNCNLFQHAVYRVVNLDIVPVAFHNPVLG